MAEYRFLDADETGYSECDIAGDEYRTLLNKCFEYCTSLSFYVRSSDVAVPAELEPYQLPLTPSIKAAYRRYTAGGQVHHYRLAHDNHSCIRSITDSVFKWIDGWGYHNPEDPNFYRADGTIFLSSCIHEGCVSLFPRDDEDVSDLIKNPLWIKTEST